VAEKAGVGPALDLALRLQGTSLDSFLMRRALDSRHERSEMTDLACLALTGAFFLVAWLYVRACEKV